MSSLFQKSTNGFKKLVLINSKRSLENVSVTDQHN